MYCSTQEFGGGRVKVGDDVLYTYAVGDVVRLAAAKVVDVHADGRVDLVVFLPRGVTSMDGAPRARTAVSYALPPEPDGTSSTGTWCWPVPTQVRRAGGARMAERVTYTVDGAEGSWVRVPLVLGELTLSEDDRSRIGAMVPGDVVERCGLVFRCHGVEQRARETEVRYSVALTQADRDKVVGVLLGTKIAGSAVWDAAAQSALEAVRDAPPNGGKQRRVRLRVVAPTEWRSCAGGNLDVYDVGATVRSAQGLEGLFPAPEKAEGYAGELRGIGAEGVFVAEGGVRVGVLRCADQDSLGREEFDRAQVYFVKHGLVHQLVALPAGCAFELYEEVPSGDAG